MVKVFILDFDGVILESANIKTDAFKELFKDYPEHVDEIVEYHIKHGGVSRYIKFAHFYKNIIKKPIDEKKMEELSERFSDLVVERMLKCPIVKGAESFLRHNSDRFIFYIASGIPQEELELLVDGRGLTKYFRGIYGTPRNKPEIIKSILQSEGISKDELVYVGDALSDYEDAKKAGVLFVARIRDIDKPNHLLDLKIPTIRNFDELKTILDGGDLH